VNKSVFANSTYTYLSSNLFVDRCKDETLPSKLKSSLILNAASTELKEWRLGDALAVVNTTDYNIQNLISAVTQNL